MSRTRSVDAKGDYGHAWVVAEALLSGAKTAEEIADYFHSYLRFAGLFTASLRFQQRERKERKHCVVEGAIRTASERGWIECTGDRFALTSVGQLEAEKMLADMRRARALLAKANEPITVSKVSLVVHFLLAALKLPAALLSGSVALLNDGIDTLLDGMSSILVFLGIRWNHERGANIALVAFMLVTGVWTAYEAVASFFRPASLAVDWLAVAAALVSAALCAGLWAYQRVIGLRAASPALITQSVDSRNHVVVAVGVLAGLFASLLRFPWLDRVVGLVVALLILKSAVELLIEIVRSQGEEEIDLTRYRFGPAERYEGFRNRRFRTWLLSFIAERAPIDRDALVKEIVQTLDFRQMAALHELGIAEARSLTAEDVGQSLDTLIRDGLVSDGAPLELTTEGHRTLRRRLGRLY